MRSRVVAVRTDRPVQSTAITGRARLSSRRPPPRYNRTNGRRPNARRVLLFLVLVAFGISLLIWRTSPPSRVTEIVPATPAITIARASLPPSQPRRPVRPSPPGSVQRRRQPETGLARTLGPAIDQLIAQYKVQGIDRVGLVIEDGREADTDRAQRGRHTSRRRACTSSSSSGGHKSKSARGSCSIQPNSPLPRRTTIRTRTATHSARMATRSASPISAA